VLTKPKNMLIRHTIFRCKLFLWFIFFFLLIFFVYFLGWVRNPQLCFWQAYAHCMDDHLPATSRTA